jgi:hypothetical protein
MVPGPWLWWPPSIAGARALPAVSVAVPLGRVTPCGPAPQMGPDRADSVEVTPTRRLAAARPAPLRARRFAGCVVLALALPLVGAPPAQAQGSSVPGTGAHYFLAGAGNATGVAASDFVFGDPGDEVYFGDFVDASGMFGGDGRDDAMVRRGATFSIRGQGGRSFVYGDPGDTVLVGDWDGDGTDTLAVRRGNAFFVKNDVTTGVADHVFVYGDPGDTVLVGNWDGDSSAADAAAPLTTDTIMVRRGHRYFVKNSTTTGVADYDFVFGEPGDPVLVGDWATPPVHGRPGASGDYADALAVRRGTTFIQSAEVWTAAAQPAGYGLGIAGTFRYGEPGDTAFTAQLEVTYDIGGRPTTVYGDGIGVRRHYGT